jgi:hypothetical protein
MKEVPSDPAAISSPGDLPRDEGPASFLGVVTPASRQGRVVCDDLDMRIDRDGIWYYHGSAIRRKELVCLFASVLTRDEDGRYWLVTPNEIGLVRVDDAPFIVVEMFNAGSGREKMISLRTNVDEIVTVNDDHSLHVVTNPETGEPSPYVRLREGIEARVARSVYYELVAQGVEEEIDGQLFFGVWSSRSFFALGKLEPET